jgi:solute:Na+ symporter, SSS family
MQLSPLDWSIVVVYFVVVLAIGAAVARRAGRNTDQYFLSGRDMPWWLLGISMVATAARPSSPAGGLSRRLPRHRSERSQAVKASRGMR